MQRLLVRQCLESEGMSVLEARDGYEALDLVSNNSPDFIFMDVDMPGISGIETCRRLRARDDANETRLLVHAMKSSAMNIGAEVLDGRLAQIEAASRDAGQTLTPDELTELEQLIKESLKQLLSHYADIRTALATGS